MAHGKIQINGQSLYLGDAYVPVEVPVDGRTWKLGKLGILGSDLEKMQARGERNKVAWLQHLVLPSMLLTRHVFRGLKRPLLTDGNRNADQQMFVYSRRSSFDLEVVATSENVLTARPIKPPQECVFVVITAPNIAKHREKYPMVDGWIDSWGWIEEDFGLPEAPTNWVNRFEKKLFTISNEERVGSD